MSWNLETALKCSEIDYALLASFKESLERKVIVCLDPIKKDAHVSNTWHVTYTSANMRVLLHGYEGDKYCDRWQTEHIPLATPDDIRALDRIQAQYYTDIWDENHWMNYDHLMDAVSNKMEGCITSGLIVDDIHDKELRTLRISRLQIMYRVSIEELQLKAIAEQNELEIVQDGCKEYLSLIADFSIDDDHERHLEKLSKSISKLINALKSAYQEDISTLLK
jgi:hypothetical protein